MKSLKCATYEGIEAKTVQVESSLTKGLPSFNIVGIASAAINESKERVKSALLMSGFSFPPKRFVINLSPADLRKEGTHFDLSIALLLLMQESDIDVSDWFVFGELGLDGHVKENVYLYPLLLSLANQKIIKKAIVPQESLSKLSKIPGVAFYGAKHLKDALTILQSPSESVQPNEKTDMQHPFIVTDTKLYYNSKYYYDFQEVKGQPVAKRAALIAAAGFHNILLEGSPGCGKSMIAQRLRYILPPLDTSTILDIAKLEALEGKEPDFNALRPFRSPHHTSTSASIFGGGVIYHN